MAQAPGRVEEWLSRGLPFDRGQKEIGEVAPHLIGAPQPASLETPIPEGLHHSFVVAVVLTTLLFWVLLGGLAGLFRGRFVHAS